MILDHLWQSSLLVVLVWLLTLALRSNRAAVRYWLWLAASVKFLIPFSLLVSFGSQFGWRTVPVISQPRVSFVMEEVSRASAAPIIVPAAAPGFNFVPILFAVWICGVAIGVVLWMRSWIRIRRAVRGAVGGQVGNLPHLPIRISSKRMEPGVFGIFKPVLLLPEGIVDRLTPARLEAILAHELCHVRRRDELSHGDQHGPAGGGAPWLSRRAVIRQDGADRSLRVHFKGRDGSAISDTGGRTAISRLRNDAFDFRGGGSAGVEAGVREGAGGCTGCRSCGEAFGELANVVSSARMLTHGGSLSARSRHASACG
jgi:BlaR1 peptidase M56